MADKYIKTVEGGEDTSPDPTTHYLELDNGSTSVYSSIANLLLELVLSTSFAWFLDEDNMASDSATKVASQQSIKAHVASGTVTMTNKRITPRVTTEASSATPTINTDNADMHDITALAAAITSFTTNLSGTPTNGQKLIVKIKDDGTARAITWGASFASTTAGTLPTTTTLGKTLWVGLMYDTVDSKWHCLAVGEKV